MIELNVVHVGAKGHPQDQWINVAKHVNLYGIDANEKACEQLEKRTQFVKSQQFFNYVIGDPYSDTLYKTRSPECYSLLEPNYGFWQDFEKPQRCQVLDTEKVEPITLTEFVDKHVEGSVDFLKLDIQGTELDVLSEYKYLDRLIGIETEMCFVELYKGQALAHHVMDFLYGNGFTMVGLKRCMWKRGDKPLFGGQLIFGDALFLKHKRIKKHNIICKAYKLYDFVGEGYESSKRKMREWDRRYGF